MIEGYGILQGEMDQSRLLTKYLNIPFAKVQNRFQQASAPEPWKGIRDATLYGPMCPQDTQESNNLSTLMLGLPGPGFEYSERDCLNLNVFAPRCIVGQAPVICYIHGGLSQGGIALPKHDATNIVKKSVARGLPVIVIALEWVKKNIHNFAGNPSEITLMGHSSGASSAGFHMLSSKSTTTTNATQQQKDDKKRLFKRAIMHSTAREGSLQHKESTPRLDSLLGDMVPVGSTLTVKSVSGREYKDRQQQQQQSKFTFMSDACLPFMDEKEKQAGWRVIDKWIDFAWGQEVEDSAGSKQGC
ncbi:hypothetical protein BGZ96_011780 [Linnemannia gamsii]|uniref:Carboxylesterase type B domain-containing protein n=1 Tax=Linnemannia gamsii TaxID=64522 RepID=A0ABQ7KCM7_9FUNG|nr:hypothetical protein BGZ96_011780 [Linnemannia gamsii]